MIAIFRALLVSERQIPALLGSFEVSNADDGEDTITIATISQYADVRDSPDLHFKGSRGTQTSPETCVGGDGAGRITFRYNNNGNFFPAAYIEAGVDETIDQPLGVSSNPGWLRIATTNSGAISGNPNLVLTSNGNVGLGPGWGFSYPYTDHVKAGLHVKSTVILGDGCEDFIHVSGALTAACGVQATGLSAGSLADGNSYLGLDTDNQVVLVGGSAPSLAGDLVAGTDCTNYFYLSSSLTAGCDSYFSGGVGIGTNDLYDVGLSHLLKVSNGEGGASGRHGIQLEKWSDDSNGPQFSFVKGRGTEASPTSVVGKDVLASWRINGWFGGTKTQGAQFQSRAEYTRGSTHNFWFSPHITCIRDYSFWSRPPCRTSSNFRKWECYSEPSSGHFPLH